MCPKVQAEDLRMSSYKPSEHSSSEQSLESMPEPQTVFQRALIRVSSDIPVFLVMTYLAFQIGAWQLVGVAWVLAALIVVDLIGLWFIRRGRPVLGAWLIVGNLWPAIIALNLLISGMGFPLAIIVIILTTFTAGQTLPRKQIGWAVSIGIGVAVLLPIIDLSGLDYRLPVPEVFLTTTSVVITVFFLVFAYLIFREFSTYSLRTKMLIVFVSVVVLAVAAIASIITLTTRQTLIDEANKKLLAGASQTAAILDNFMQTNLDTVKAEALLPDFVKYLGPDDQRPTDIKPSAALISLNGKDAQNITSYALLDSEGINVSDSHGLNIGANEANQDYFQIPFNTGKVYVSPVLFSPDTNEGTLYFSSPVHNVVGQTIGVLRLAYKADVLQKLVEENTAGEDSFAVLFDENHLHLAHSDQEVSLQTNYKLVALPDSTEVAELQAAGRIPNAPIEELSTELPELEQNLSNLDPSAPYFEAVDVTPEGEQLNQVAVVPMNTRPWLVAFIQPQELLFQPAQVQARNIVFMAILISAAAAVVAVVVSQQLANPIVRLTHVAEQVAQGDLTTQAPVESQDEIGQLSIAFNSMTNQLRDVVESLEDQVQERITELALSMEVGQRASTIRELDELLPIIIEFIRTRFDLYYAHIYFLDDIGRNLIIRAGTGTVGKELMARRHNLPMGGNSIVGRAAAAGQSIVVSDTEQSDIHMPNPLLPKTRSELAVPLIVEGRVMGVLDMQADTANTFTEQNLTVFEAMATQLAISIDGAQLWALSVDAQQKSEQALKQFAQQVWAEKLASQQESLGYMYDLSSITPLKSDLENGVSVPVVVQNQPIGRLSVAMPANRDLSDDEHTLLEAVTQQLTQKAENLRLFEQTQQRAAREQLTRQIIDKVRAAYSVEDALQTAVEELSKALGEAHTFVTLEAEQANDRKA